MKRASITQTKNQLSALIDAVRQGETVLITDRDRPVARLEPVLNGVHGAQTKRLAMLERSGIIRLGTSRPPKKLIGQKPPKAEKGASVLKALLADREEGR